MHDPRSVAFEIKRPWPTKGSGLGGYRHFPTLVTIWHVDPERDGTDDSCGWFSPKLTKDELKKLEDVANFEMKYLFSKTDDKDEWTPKVDSVSGCFHSFKRVAWVWKKRIEPRHMPEVISLCTDVFDSFRDTFTRPQTAYDIRRMFFFMGRAFKRMERYWWQRPRFHFWHWEIQVHAIQNLKRWLFSRCAQCGGRFKWGESCVSHQWESSGPLWFRSEQAIYHTWHREQEPTNATP
jgi:hypothetical protein